MVQSDVGAVGKALKLEEDLLPPRMCVHRSLPVILCVCVFFFCVCVSVSSRDGSVKRKYARFEEPLRVNPLLTLVVADIRVFHFFDVVVVVVVVVSSNKFAVVSVPLHATPESSLLGKMCFALLIARGG